MSPLSEHYEKQIKQWDKEYGVFWYDNVDGKIDQKLLDEVKIIHVKSGVELIKSPIVVEL